MRTDAHAEILWEILPERHQRANPRVVKRKMSNFAVKRAHHKPWPQPTRRSQQAVQVHPPDLAA